VATTEAIVVEEAQVAVEVEEQVSRTTDQQTLVDAAAGMVVVGRMVAMADCPTDRLSLSVRFIVGKIGLLFSPRRHMCTHSGAKCWVVQEHVQIMATQMMAVEIIPRD